MGNVNMNTDAHISVMQTHPVQPNERISRIRALRILGGLQIILGIVCCILGMVGAIISNTEITSRCKNYHNNHGIEVYMSSYHCRQTNTILIMDIIGMAFSGWFILTGGLPLCMTGQRQSRWRCMIIAYLVCNIILAAVFSPTVVALGIIGALDVDLKTNTRRVIVLSSLLAIFSCFEFIISIVAALYCCCCSQLNMENHQGVIFMNTAQSGMVYSMPNTPISLENQQGYHQMQMNQMHGFNGQQPANIPNYQQQADYTQGNRIPVQENYGQHLQAFATGNQ
ncbi:uncharacterized protein LOC127702409 isoform X2 [Mytilus californianus]|uniref:uncharacterized protein LOC127702409 isoform X2 n=1 Tax=Mytilus californianus TaxID=6549 RepID=UPI0022453C6B|nr:uncharacterized protein LOC127702409 isoform X2 [Mytilus californianus]